MKLFLLRLFNYIYFYQPKLYSALYLALKSISETREKHLLRKFLSPGCVVFDVGSNIGFYSLFFAQYHNRSLSVHSFEPHPSNFWLLKQNLARLSNVFLNQTLVGDSTKQAILYLSSLSSIDHHAYPSPENQTEITVPQVSIDDYCNTHHIHRLDLIKIDVQGYEPSVIQGATKTIKQLHPHILLEFWPYGLIQAGFSPHLFLSYLLSSFTVIDTTIPMSQIHFLSQQSNPERLHYCDMMIKT